MLDVFHDRLIKQLTGTEQNQKYMENLKNLLLEDGNLLSFFDAKQAYSEILIDLQLDIWERIYKVQQEKFPEMGQPDEDSIFNNEPRETVKKFYKQSRKNRYYGIFYSFSNSEGGVGAEIENAIYTGVWCNKTKHREQHKKFVEIYRDKFKGSTTNHWPLWVYTNDDINYKNPSRSAIEKLSSTDSRQKIAEDIANHLYELWCVVEKKLESGIITICNPF